MRLATWNVNSLRVRLPHVIAWLTEEAGTEVDLLGLQETKLIDAKFPKADIEAAGYHVVFAGQPTYNGVAILAKKSRFKCPEDLVINNPHFADEQVRIITATLWPICADDAHEDDEPLRLVNAYIPNGAAVGSDKYDYKLRWLDALRVFVEGELKRFSRLALVGDYNIAPEDIDVHDPDEWAGQVLCSPAERERFQALINLGLTDSFRLHPHNEKSFSWWDYRQAGFRRNRGLRIDHVLLSPALATLCVQSGIDTAPRKKEQPSDHAPVWTEMST
jgi:exodeoxyribonuclease-3